MNFAIVYLHYSRPGGYLPMSCWGGWLCCWEGPTSASHLEGEDLRPSSDGVSLAVFSRSLQLGRSLWQLEVRLARTQVVRTREFEQEANNIYKSYSYIPCSGSL